MYTTWIEMQSACVGDIIESVASADGKAVYCWQQTIGLDTY